jgi:DNA modification methylase
VSRAERIHAAEKPLPLLEQIIEFSTFPGERVIDPYAGSGSTLAAAKRTGRHSIGFEIEPTIVDEALVRLSKEEEND